MGKIILENLQKGDQFSGVKSKFCVLFSDLVKNLSQILGVNSAKSANLRSCTNREKVV